MQPTAHLHAHCRTWRRGQLGGALLAMVATLLVAASATLDELDYYRRNFQTVIQTREKLGGALGKLGFIVYPSQSNFILVQPPMMSAREWLERLRERNILVRWFEAPGIRNYLRITIGTPAEAEALVKAARAILADTRAGEG